MPRCSAENDIELEYRVAGPADAPRILLISGTGSDMRAPSIVRNRLEKRFTVCSFDQRGLGRSSKPDRPFTMADYATDAVTLLDHLGWETAAIVGVSFGGMVAQELAVTWPERVACMVLACTSSGGQGGSSFPLHTIEKSGDDEADALALYELADVRMNADWRAENAELVDAMLRNTFRIKSIGADDPGREIGAQRQLEARVDHDTYDRLHRLSMPCLVQGGRFDGIAPPANLERLAAAIPGATLAMYDGGHAYFLQDRSSIDDACEFLVANTPTPALPQEIST